MHPMPSLLKFRTGRRWLAPLAGLLTLMAARGCRPDLAAADWLRVQVGPASFQVELAQTQEEKTRGLMFRTQLPEGQGMLFIQEEPERAVFWMKNTLIPLDLLFFDSTGTLLEIFPEVPPCRQPDCPNYPSRSTAIRYILEINGGLAHRLGIRIGDTLRPLH